MLIGCMFGLLWLQAQSRGELLRNMDPIFTTALDSLEMGRPQAAISQLNVAGEKFKKDQNWLKYAGSLLVLGKVYFQTDQLDSSLFYLHEARRIASREGNERLAANTDEGIARIYLIKKQNTLAMQHYRKFASWCLRSGKPRAKVETCIQMAQIYTRKVEPDSVALYLHLGLSLAKSHDFPVLQYKLYQMLGLRFNNINRPDSALYHYHQSLELLEKHPAPEREILVYLRISHVFLDNENPQRARKYLRQAQKLLQTSTNPFPKATLLYYEGTTLLAEKKGAAAILVLEKALEAFKSLPKPQRHQAMQARCLKSLAEAQHMLGQNEKALASLKLAKALNLPIFQRYNEMQTELMEAAILSSQDAVAASDELLMENMVWAKKSENLNYLLELYQTLAANERKKKNYEQAIVYLDKVHALQQQLDPVSRASSLSNHEAQWEVAKKDKSIGHLHDLNQQKAQRLKQTQLRTALMAGGLLFLLLSSVWIYRRKRKQNIQLSLAKQAVEASLQEKELLLKEIHHRVKNNMQVISSLLNLQARGVQDPVALKVMREGRDRVRSMALIHQTLYQNNDFSTVETEDYFLKLAENLFHTYNIDQERVQLVAQIQPLKFNVDIMIALGLILNELISNTLKYAFPAEQKGEVRISLTRNAEQVELKVEDNGVGFPPNFAPNAARSIGFSLIHAFTQKLGGSLQINNAEKGAMASLIFPLHHNASPAA